MEYAVPLDRFYLEVGNGPGVVVGASLNRDPGAVRRDGELYPFVVGSNARLVREAPVLVNDFQRMHGEHSAETTANASVTSPHLAAFDALALQHPQEGNYSIVFSVVGGVGLNVSIPIFVHSGRAHHLGVAAPCEDFSEPCNSTTRPLSVNGTYCTCSQYNVNDTVELSPILTYVLDAGENILINSHNSDCDADAHACSGHVITLQHDELRTGMCELDPSDATDIKCKQPQPKIFAGGIPASGTYNFYGRDDESSGYEFSGYGLIRPHRASRHNPLLLSFNSPGLIGVSFGLEIKSGDPYQLGRVLPQSFVSSFFSAFITTISDETRPIFIQVRDIGGSLLQDYNSVPRNVTVTCTTSVLGQYPGGPRFDSSGISFEDRVTTESDVASFLSIRILSPPAGTHVLTFSTPDEPHILNETLEVDILEGEPVRLKVATITPSYRAQPVVNLNPINIQLSDAGSNPIGTANFVTKMLYANISGGPMNEDGTPGYEQVTENEENVERLQPGSGSVKFDTIMLRSPLAGVYNISFSGEGIVGDFLSFSVVLGDAYKLNVPADSVITKYSAKRIVEIRGMGNSAAFSFKIMDGGNNFMGVEDLDQLGAGLRREVYTSVSGDLIQIDNSDDESVVLTPGGAVVVGTEIATTRFVVTSPQRSQLGEGNIEGLRLINPRLGVYNVTISSEGLVAYSFEVFVTPGSPSSLDVCGCPSCVRREADGVCVDKNPYYASYTVSLRDAVVVMRDAGGALVGSGASADNMNRNISGELIYGKSQETETEFSYTVNMTVLSNSSQTYIEAIDGMVAWCGNATRVSSVPSFCSPHASQLAMDDVTGKTGFGLVYYGIQTEPRWTGRTSSLDLELPYSGVYRFQFSSTCESSCTYSDLQLDQLEVTVLPGSPHHLQFVTTPPDHFENDFIISPSIELKTLDVAGNICTNLNTFAVVSSSPSGRRIHGQTAPVIHGICSFSKLRLRGSRGVAYTLRFELVTIGLALEHRPFFVTPCEKVKPNSQNDGRGQCECLPGYTEDTRPLAFGGTGFTDGMSSVSSYPDLYTHVVYRPEGYLRALNPYGVCVPCANGYFKPHAGPQQCTPCPFQMDTMWEAGGPKSMWSTMSGEHLPGHLGNHDKNACHCVVRTRENARDPSLETFRLLPEGIFRCARCPDGGLCNGLSREQIVVNEGRWRANRNVTVLYECPNERACLGGENSECARGYDGNLCAVCAAGYAHPTIAGRNPPRCKACTSTYIGGVVIIVQFMVQGILIMMMFRVASRERNGSVGLCKTLLSHFQMLVRSTAWQKLINRAHQACTIPTPNLPPIPLAEVPTQTIYMICFSL